MLRSTSTGAAAWLVIAAFGCGGADDLGTAADDATAAEGELRAAVAASSSATTTTRVRLREGPSTSSATLAILEPGTRVTLTDGQPRSSFYAVVVEGGATGYVHGAYLDLSTASPTDPGPSTAGLWQPAPGTSWQWQLTGTLDESLDVEMFDLDLENTSTTTIARLKSRGRKVICYFSAGSSEDWRSDYGRFRAADKGSPLDGWPGERWLDIRSANVRSIMTARLDRAKAKGCDGVEPDNVDAYDNGNGLGLTQTHELDFLRFLAREAHARGLSIGLKNALALIPQLVSTFDWALNEECVKYSECSAMRPFIDANKAVFHAEYEGSRSRVCNDGSRARFSTLIKNLDLDRARTACP